MAWENQTQGQWDPKKKIYRKFKGLAGVSDILGVLPGGQFLAIEIKRPKTRNHPKSYCTKHQKEFISKIRELGGVALVVRSVDELKEALDFILVGPDYPVKPPEIITLF